MTTGTFTRNFLIATNEKKAQMPEPRGMTGASSRKYRFIEEVFKRWEKPPAVDVEARNRPTTDARMPKNAKDSCLRDKLGFSTASIIKKKIADANDTNEKTTKT